MTSTRLSRLESNFKNNHLDALVLNPGATLVYLTGLHFHLMERPTVLFIRPGKTSILVCAGLEKLKTAGSTIPLQTITYSDNPESWQAAFNQAVQTLGLDGASIGVESNHLRFLEMQFLQIAAPKAKFLSGDSSLEQLRICKDKPEITLMQKAVQIAQDGLTATLPIIKPGVTELEIASELTLQLLKAGSSAELPFQPIVSGGPNSADPHAVPTDRKLRPGDMLVVDWGAAYQGYISDLTRTFAIGKVTPEFQKIADSVLQANLAGQKAAAPGKPACSIDQAARSVIENAGYGQYFTHRTGHGIGMESHEPPYIFGENNLVLEPGMTFTVEPGIYLPGVGGVRIEDNLVITESGARSLSDMPRELKILG